MWETFNSSETQIDKVILVVKGIFIYSLLWGKEVRNESVYFSKDYPPVVPLDFLYSFLSTFQRSDVLQWHFRWGQCIAKGKIIFVYMSSSVFIPLLMTKFFNNL